MRRTIYHLQKPLEGASASGARVVQLVGRAQTVSHWYIYVRPRLYELEREGGHMSQKSEYWNRDLGREGQSFKMTFQTKHRKEEKAYAVDVQKFEVGWTELSDEALLSEGKLMLASRMGAGCSPQLTPSPAQSVIHELQSRKETPDRRVGFFGKLMNLANKQAQRRSAHKDCQLHQATLEERRDTEAKKGRYYALLWICQTLTQRKLQRLALAITNDQQRTTEFFEHTWTSQDLWFQNQLAGCAHRHRH